MIIGKMSIVQNFHGYSDTVVVVVAAGEVDGVADIGEKNKLISTILIWISLIFGLVETVETARLFTFFLALWNATFCLSFFWSYLIIVLWIWAVLSCVVVCRSDLSRRNLRSSWPRLSWRCFFFGDRTSVLNFSSAWLLRVVAEFGRWWKYRGGYFQS